MRSTDDMQILFFVIKLIMNQGCGITLRFRLVAGHKQNLPRRKRRGEFRVVASRTCRQTVQIDVHKSSPHPFSQLVVMGIKHIIHPFVV